MPRKPAARQPARKPRKRVPARGRQVIRGRGNYFTDAVGAVGRGVGRVFKTASGIQTGMSLGGAVGGPLGALAGGAAGALLAIGSGTYQVKKNTLMKPDAVPYMHSTDSSIRIRHKEYICDIVGSTDFNLKAFAINPGLRQSFPYLAGIAQNFEMYKINGMIFVYKAQSAYALNSTNTALGTVIMATDYNCLDDNYTDKQSMEAGVFASSGRPSKDLLHPIECAKHLTSVEERFIRTGAISTGDLRFSDWGNFQIATSAMQAAATIGELWVTYDVTLMNPQLTIPRGLTIPMAHVFGVGYTNTTPLGAATLPFDTIGLTSLTALGFTMPAQLYGTWMFTMEWKGSSTATLTLPSITASNLDANTSWINHAEYSANNDGNTGARLINSVFYTIDNPLITTSVAFGVGGTLPSSGAFMDLWITQVNGGCNYDTQ